MMSSFVNAKPENPLIMCVYCNMKVSSHPHLLGLPVVVPNSCPLFLNNSSISLSPSVGNGPVPTLVRYALTTPYTSPIFLGGTPNPVQIAPIEQLLEVTLGYVPKSMSNIVAFAPSTSIVFCSSCKAWLM